MNAKDQWARDQISAVLRDSPVPMTASDIGQLVPVPRFYQCTGVNPCLEEHGWAAMMKIVSAAHVANIDAIFPRSTLACWIMPHLKPLLRTGDVVRSKVGRRVVWSWTGDAGTPASDLEALLLL